MNPNRKRRLSAATSRTKLRAATGANDEPLGARLWRWWHRGFRKSSFSAVYGIFLGLPAVVLTATFFDSVAAVTAGEAFWKTDIFGYFAVGAAVWTLWFFGSTWTLGAPQPLHAYVFGHELTHAIWVWMWRGRVYDKKMWSSDGGYIVTDTNNFWIALAPYFYPLYSLLLIVIYGVASRFADVAHATATFLLLTPLQWLYFLLGVTWAFHLTFTFWMIPKGQTDLTAHGTFFSLMVIYLMNLLLLIVFLIIASPELDFRTVGGDLLARAEDFSETAWHLLSAVWVRIFPGHPLPKF